MSGPLDGTFYARSVHAVAGDLVGCTIRHGGTAARIVEVESYHESEPACHAYVGPTPRNRTLFGPPGHAYVYRSYGIHALLNFVAEGPGVGAAVLIRALEPLEGVDLMLRRRGSRPARDLCSGPGKLTQALAIGLEHDGASLTRGPIEVLGRDEAARPPVVVTAARVGITRAVELPWRFCDATSDCVSRPWPASLREMRRAA